MAPVRALQPFVRGISQAHEIVEGTAVEPQGLEKIARPVQKPPVDQCVVAPSRDPAIPFAGGISTVGIHGESVQPEAGFGFAFTIEIPGERPQAQIEYDGIRLRGQNDAHQVLKIGRKGSVHAEVGDEYFLAGMLFGKPILQLARQGMRLPGGIALVPHGAAEDQGVAQNGNLQSVKLSKLFELGIKSRR